MPYYPDDDTSLAEQATHLQKLDMPKWLASLDQPSSQYWFYENHHSFALQHTERKSGTLYVGFDNLTNVRSKTRMRDPWGYGFAEKSNWSFLGIMAFDEHWFREPLLFDRLQRLAQEGFFRRYDKVIFSGTSMGGYGACAFSSLAPGSIIVVFSPQSTLDPGIAGWDPRYPEGSRADWSGPYSDATKEIQAAKRVWIVYDPYADLDRKHAERFQGDNITHLKARRSDHFGMQLMRRTGTLSTFVHECVDESMAPSRFYQLYREGRYYRTYLKNLVEKIVKNGNMNEYRKDKLERILLQAKRPQLANALKSG